MRSGEPERVERAHAVDLERRDRISQIVTRACRRCEVQHEIEVPVDRERFRDVVPQELEVPTRAHLGEVRSNAREKAVDADDLPTLGHEPVAEM